MNTSPTLKPIHLALLFWTLVLGACTQTGVSPEAVLPTPADVASAPADSDPAISISTKEVIPPPKLVATLSTPHIDPGPNGELPDSQTIPPAAQPCGYMWASQNLTDLTLDLQQAIKDLQPEAQAYAFAFGEDCIYQDGQKTFIAMETDFNVTLPVADLTNENDLGEWIARTMQVIGDLPAEKIVGPRPGRITTIFTTGTDQKFVTFYIDRYQALPTGMKGWEIYQALQAQQ